MTTAPTISGIDLGMHWCHLSGLDARGATMLRKQLHRGHRAERHRRDSSVFALAPQAGE